jgi:hypothetical protein
LYDGPIPGVFTGDGCVLEAVEEVLDDGLPTTPRHRRKGTSIFVERLYAG